MYTIKSLNGDHLPDKTLCLTYDDGPGESTLAIAEYLYSEHIRATFFVVGKYAVHQTPILSALSRMEHIIGNHTYEHPDLPYYVSVGGDVQNQILRTDAIIRSYSTTPIFFRAPYGKWSTEVANELNVNLLASVNTVGPVHWEIGGIDCYFWQQDKSVEEALESYLTTINEKRHGIVVMHDEIADMDVVKSKNKTLALTRQLIPVLKQQGYSFVGLDEVLKTQSVVPESFDINLIASNGKCMAVGSANLVSARGTMKTNDSRIVYMDLGNGTAALRGSNGNYLCVNEQTKSLEATSPALHSTAIFHIIPVSDNRLMIRTKSGNFIALEGSNKQLAANAPYMRQAEIFTYFPLHSEANKNVSFSRKIKLLAMQMAFVKTKLLSKLQKS